MPTVPAPKSSPGVVVDLNLAGLRAVIHGRRGAVVLFRDAVGFYLNDLEAEKLFAARELYLNRRGEEA